MTLTEARSLEQVSELAVDVDAYWARQRRNEVLQLRVDADTLERAAELLREPYRPWAPDFTTAHDLERNARALRVAAKRLEKEAQR